MRDEESVGAETIGLDAGARACLFDLDKVSTRTVEIRAQAWKTAFNDFLCGYDANALRENAPLGAHTDYELYLDVWPGDNAIRAFNAGAAGRGQARRRTPRTADSAWSDQGRRRSE